MGQIIWTENVFRTKWRHENEKPNEIKWTNLPDAEHSIRTDAPFLTCMWPPELMWCILGGTVAGKLKRKKRNKQTNKHKSSDELEK